MAKVRTFSGRIPDDSWNYAGIVDGDNGLRFLVYEKETFSCGEPTGYKYLKFVLESGKKARKGNYWLSVRINDAYLVHNTELWKMKEHAPKLYKSAKKFVEEEN